MRVIDSHAHLHDPAFDEDRAETLERGRAAGVEAVVTVGTDRAASEAALALARQERDVFAVVGFHPRDAKDWNPHERAHIERLASCAPVVAIGEIGLDFFRDLSPRPAQRRAFRDQLALARSLRMPVVIHSRDAAEETYAILAEWSPTVRPAGAPGAESGPVGVIHCFSGDAALARRYVELGFVISFAGPVTYPKNADLREAAQVVPGDRIVVETDAPYLSPQGHLGSSDRRGRSLRGKRNEPAHVSLTAAFIAELRGEGADAFARETAATTRTLFRLPPSA